MWLFGWYLNSEAAEKHAVLMEEVSGKGIKPAGLAKTLSWYFVLLNLDSGRKVFITVLSEKRGILQQGTV